MDQTIYLDPSGSALICRIQPLLKGLRIQPLFKGLFKCLSTFHYSFWRKMLICKCFPVYWPNPMKDPDLESRIRIILLRICNPAIFYATCGGNLNINSEGKQHVIGGHNRTFVICRLKKRIVFITRSARSRGIWLEPEPSFRPGSGFRFNFSFIIHANCTGT